MATLSHDNGSDWRASAVRRRDFRHSKDGPEEIPYVKHKKLKGCKKNKEHVWKWYPAIFMGKALSPRWRCDNCQKYTHSWKAGMPYAGPTWVR